MSYRQLLPVGRTDGGRAATGALGRGTTAVVGSLVLVGAAVTALVSADVAFADVSHSIA